MELAISSKPRSCFDIDDEEENIGAELLSAAGGEGQSKKILCILQRDPTLIHVTDPVGDTILHVVARLSTDVELVSKLVMFVREKGLSKVLIEQNSQGNTPLHLVVKNNPINWTILGYLLTANRNAEKVVNEDGLSPKRLALEAGYCWCTPCAAYSDIEMEMVRWAIHETTDEDEPCPNLDESKPWMELSLAIKQGQEGLVQQILEKDPTLIWYKAPSICPSYDRKHTMTALHDAAKAGNVGMLRLLVRSMTPHELLMNYTLEGDKKDKYKSITPLHLALYRGHQDAARYLIQLSPKTAYQVNYWGVSPLYLAVEKGYAHLVRYIFQLMPANAVPPSIKRDLFAAQKNKSKSLANAAIKTTNLEILEAITKELPVLMDTEDYKGWRPLSYAAYTGFVDGVSYLLTNFPASAKKYDRDGSLPIHKAVGGGHVSAVKAFHLHSPQTLYEVDRKGQSILHFAVKCAKPDVLQYLTKELEAEVFKIYNLRDDNGKTFMDLANQLK